MLIIAKGLEELAMLNINDKKNFRENPRDMHTPIGVGESLKLKTSNSDSKNVFILIELKEILKSVNASPDLIGEVQGITRTGFNYKLEDDGLTGGQEIKFNYRYIWF
jgi:hypothetical protein